MTPQKQIFRHRPENGVYGDCYRTALACILDMKPEDLPHEHRVFGDNEQRQFYDAALKPFGFKIALFAWTCSLEEVFEVMKISNPGIHYILSGWSRSNCNHSVVALEGEIVHDPSLTNAGIVGPCDNGAYYVELLVRA
ncbi:hypothetical protein CPT_Sansa87 [Caulobacter phage Sansa]|uniref:Uncharacterized protein n=1 Tax=Caulobacter phage Sansa TaxID=1675600 RepID=A0A0K1LLW1_9CAUD|nr:hypothetical protein HOR07_gp087 [Caulobacter phage Sansa]AKU43491.1 hypothetical protein CPT_Sansa87 [Caulobacter phage Sansa]